MAGGVQAVTVAIAMATDGDIAAVFVPVIARDIDPDNAMRTIATCTIISAISLDLQRKVRREIQHDRLRAIQDKTTSMPTRVAMSIAGMTKVGGNKDRKVVGKGVKRAVNQAVGRVPSQAVSQAVSRVVGQVPNRATAITPQVVSS